MSNEVGKIAENACVESFGKAQTGKDGITALTITVSNFFMCNKFLC